MGRSLLPIRYAAGPLRNFARYAVPIGSVSIAALLRYYLDPYLEWKGPYVFFILAVLLSARFAGRVAGLLATALGVLFGYYLFVQPRFSLEAAHLSDTVNLTLFSLAGVAISIICGQLRAALASSTMHLAAIVDSSEDAIVSMSQDSKILSWNPGAERLFGYSAQEIIGRPVATLIPAELLPEVTGVLDRVRRGETVANFESERLDKQGRGAPVSLTVSAVKDARGQIVATSAIVRDLGSRKRTEEALRTSEAEVRQLNETLEELVAQRTAELQTILDAAPIPIWIAHDAECRRITGNIYADQTVMRISRGGNISASAMHSEAAVSYKVLAQGRELQPNELPAQVATASGLPVRDQAVDLLFSDGRTVSLLLSAAPLLDSEGHVRGAIIAGVDVTKLREAEQFSDSILSSLSASVAVIGSDGTIVATNRSWQDFARAHGNPPLIAVGPSANYLHVCRRAASDGIADAQAALTGIQAVLNGECSSFQLEYPCHSATELRWFLMQASAFKGAAAGAVISHTDISDRKRAEIALQTSEFTIRSLLASAPQAVIAVRSDENIVFANGHVEKMFGYPPEELLGQPLAVLIPENARARHSAHHKSYFADMRTRPMGIGFDLEGRRKDGAHFPVEIGLSVIQNEDGKLAVAFVSDITERKRLEKVAQARAQEVQALAASLLTAQEDERRKISRELHDQICQQLAYVSIKLDDLLAESDSETLKPKLEALQYRVIQAVEMTRHIAHQLHPSILDDLGVVAALQSLCDEFAEQQGLRVEFTHNNLPSPIPREVVACFYRVVQQSLRNIAQHAEAKHIAVKLTVNAGNLSLSIEDDGLGFDPENIEGRGALGLTGMRERAKLVHGTLTITAKRGHGTRVAIEIPWAAL